MNKTFKVFIELVPDLINELCQLIKELEKYNIQSSIVIDGQYIEDKKTYRNVKFNTDNIFDNFEYIGTINIENVDNKNVFKLKTYKEDKEQLLLEVDEKECYLCKQKRPRNEIHCFIVDGIVRSIGESCLENISPSILKKIKALQLIEQKMERIEYLFIKRMNFGSLFDNYIANKLEIFCVSLYKINKSGYNYFNNNRNRTFNDVYNTLKNDDISSRIEKENALSDYKDYYEHFVKFIELEKENLDNETYTTICENKSEYTYFLDKVVYASYKYTEKNIIIPKFTNKLNNFITQEKRIFKAGDIISENVLITRVSNTIPINNRIQVFVGVLLNDGTYCSFKTKNKSFIERLKLYKVGTIINIRFKFESFIENDKHNFYKDTWKINCLNQSFKIIE